MSSSQRSPAEPSTKKRVRFDISQGKGAGDTPPEGESARPRISRHGRRQPAVGPLKPRKSSIAAPRGDKSQSILESFRRYWTGDVIPDIPASPPKSSYRFVFEDSPEWTKVVSESPQHLGSSSQPQPQPQQSPVQSSSQEGGVFHRVIPFMSAIVAKGLQKLSQQSSQPQSQHSPLTQRDHSSSPSTP